MVLLYLFIAILLVKIARLTRAFISIQTPSIQAAIMMQSKGLAGFTNHQKL
jgi:hypothetical protein